MSRMCRLGVLLSGRGSNFSAIMGAIGSGELPNAEVVLVVSNHADAAGLDVAKGNGLPTAVFHKGDFEDRQSMDRAIADALRANGVDVVILAGYDRIVGAPLLGAYPGRILNIHPSLLPAYGGKGMLGMKVHAAVLAGGETQSGCSVHIVTDVVDGGAVLGQAFVPVHPDDTPEALSERVLAEEHRLYPKTIGMFIEQYLDGNQCDERNAMV